MSRPCFLPPSMFRPSHSLFFSFCFTAALVSAHHTTQDAIRGTAILQNNNDASYYVSLTLGGQQYSMLVDTGSSDIWIAGKPPLHSVDLGSSGNITYVEGMVTGHIHAANAEFAGLEIPDQAFMVVEADDTHPAGEGIIGLGPRSGSAIYEALRSPLGLPVLDRIFLQDTSTSNYLTLSMGRRNALEETASSLAISILPFGMENTTNQPELPVTIISDGASRNQHFQVLLDEDGVRGPDGKPIRLTAKVKGGHNPRQATAFIDSGFSLSQVPRAAADAIYSRVEGSEFRELGMGIGRTWTVPCAQEVNVSFKLGGVEYPIHPLDVSMDPTAFGLPKLTNKNGDASCVGMFQPITCSAGSNPTYDIILGMSFLRNVHALFNYGNFVEGFVDNLENPYVQLLPLTNLTAAHREFVQVRLNGIDTTGEQRLRSTLNIYMTIIQHWRRTIVSGIIFGAFAVVGSITLLILWYRHRASTGRSRRHYTPIHLEGETGYFDLLASTSRRTHSLKTHGWDTSSPARSFPRPIIKFWYSPVKRASWDSKEPIDVDV